MSYAIHYDMSLPEEQRDCAAVRDVQAYLTPKHWNALMAFIPGCITLNHARGLDVALAFAGVKGYPVFAFMRTYLKPDLYKEWHDSLED